MKISGAQGRRVLVGERKEYFRLMDQGLSNREACRIVGINRRTGERWRSGWKPTAHYNARPPISEAQQPTTQNTRLGNPAERLAKLLAPAR